LVAATAPATLVGATVAATLVADTATATLGTPSTWKTGVYDLTLTQILNPLTGGVTTDALLYGGIKVSGV
jgi:hypothetical protein